MLDDRRGYLYLQETRRICKMEPFEDAPADERFLIRLVTDHRNGQPS